MSLNIGIIVSTTRPTRVGRVVADWFYAKVKDTEGLNFSILDLAEENLPFMNEQESPSSGKYELEHTKKWSKKINDCDGFVFVTAEYNNSMPAPLKNAIDTVYHEWDKKPVAFVGYGAYGGVRSVEQLVNISAKVGMMPLSKTAVGIMDPWSSISKDSGVNEDYLHGNVEGLVKNLTWWANVLKDARVKE